MLENLADAKTLTASIDFAFIASIALMTSSLDFAVNSTISIPRSRAARFQWWPLHRIANRIQSRFKFWVRVDRELIPSALQRAISSGSEIRPECSSIWVAAPWPDLARLEQI